MDRQEMVIDTLMTRAKDAPWPDENRIFVEQIDNEADMLAIIGGLRRHWPMYEHSTSLDVDPREPEPWRRPRVGDLIVFQRWLPHLQDVSAAEPAIGQITHLWQHDGIAPGWLIVSFRLVRLIVD